LSGVDDFISFHASGHGPLIVLLLAFALGLRHASDPDHLVAVSTLVADTRGHATTLLAFGLPVLLFRSYLPHAVEQSAEALIGLIIVLLAVRLLVRRRRVHVHPTRTPRQAFGIGLVHGTAGSAGVAVLLLAAIPSTALACGALVILVFGCTISMALLSAGFGGAFGAAGSRRRLARAIPALGSLALAFGGWYLVAALQAM